MNLRNDEAKSVIDNSQGNHRLIVQWLCGSGLRVSEAIRLRVKDIDFANNGLFVMETKGNEITCLDSLLLDNPP